MLSRVGSCRPGRVVLTQGPLSGAFSISLTCIARPNLIPLPFLLLLTPTWEMANSRYG